MKKISSLGSKISIKLFLITALIFTSMLVTALYAQSYYYRQTYVMSKARRILTDYSNLSKDINEADGDTAVIAKALNRYKNQYQLEGIIFNVYGNDLKYTAAELDYKPSALLEEAVDIYYRNMLSSMEENFAAGLNMYQPLGEGYRFSDGHRYNIVVSNILNDGEVLLAVGRDEASSTPGIIDQYFPYILAIGILVSVTLSFFFSMIVSRPLVRMNSTAKEMAALDFSKKINIKGKDEIGQLAQSLNILSENLNHTLKSLTEANAQLASDIEREKSLEKTRKEFVANISHELKTPITIIQGFSHALNDNIREDKKERYANQIMDQADHMNRLVQDMLDLSKIESGQYQPVLADFNLVTLTEDILDRLHLAVSEKNLQINRRFSGNKIILRADRLKISQVIINFLDNAIRHTPNGGNIYIDISVQEGHVWFSVENEGAPIDPLVLDKVWDRFYRGNDDRSKKTGGTGLGLAISSKILQMHDMGYGVSNTERGVVFYFHAAQF